MRVPEEAASGSAKATLSFPGWKEGSVEAVTFEIKVVDGGAGVPGTPPPAEVKK